MGERVIAAEHPWSRRAHDPSCLANTASKATAQARSYLSIDSGKTLQRLDPVDITALAVGVSTLHQSQRAQHRAVQALYFAVGR